MIRSFRRDRRGAAAVEFGLIAPVLAVMLVGVADGANTLLKYNAMHSAVSSGAQYIMAGGQDLATARTIALSAWKSAPADADVAVTKACKCGAAAAVCTTLCTDQSVPTAYITVASSGNVNGAVVTRSISAVQTIRVR